MTKIGNLPEVVSREEWDAARRELLAKEKELTRLRDRVNADRRRLPMVRVDKPYEFDGPDGKVSLLDLFEGRPQLVMHHFMFAPDWDEGCASCSSAADGIGRLRQLHVRNTTLVAVSRAPYEKLAAYRERMGWEFPWYSSYGTDFNYDFGVTIDESRGAAQYNFRTKAEFEALGSDFFTYDQPFEMPGRSCFLQVDGRVFHTYSQYARGLESTGGSYYFLDLTALGRQEEWEEPKGRSQSVRGARPDFAS